MSANDEGFYGIERLTKEYFQGFRVLPFLHVSLCGFLSIGKGVEVEKYMAEKYLSEGNQVGMILTKP